MFTESARYASDVHHKFSMYWASPSGKYKVASHVLAHPCMPALLQPRNR